MSDTPRTDAKTRNSWFWDTEAMDYRPSEIVVDAEFARQLERELAACMETLENIKTTSSSSRIRRIAGETIERIKSQTT
jgi:hypothetical protein